MPRRYAAAERKNPCGTRNAYYRHLHHGETPCDDCSEANRRYHEQRRRARGARPLDEAVAEWKREALARHPHGTKQRYDLHQRHGETPCDLCREGHNAYCRDKRHEQRRRQGVPELGRRKPTYAQWLASIGLAELGLEDAA